MELYTKTNLKRVAVAFGLILIMPVSSCKKLDEDKINTDTKKLEHGPYVAGSYITGMMQNIIRSCPTDIAQLQQSLNADVYSGYMASATPFAGGTNNLTYHMIDGWNNQIAQVPYSFVLNPWLQVKKETMETEKELYAISLIIKVTAAHRLTDVFGPIPYTQLGTSVAPAFDSQETIYNTFFTELKTAVDILTAAEDKDPDLDRIKLAPYDVSSLGGDFKLWVQYANTLRLRLAIRIANVNPTLAQTEGHDAATHKYGPLQIPFSISTSCVTNYVSQISNVWHDISLNADMESYLTGYKDPRAAKYAHPATAPSTVVGQIKGIRNGIVVAGKNYVGYSSLNIAAEDKQLIMTAAEGYFLRAEGVLNKWDMGAGSVQSFYEEGIKKSFEQYSLAGASDYYNNDSLTPADYVDVLDSKLNIGKPTTITIKWDGNATPEKQLERIITQKWIAMFPEGQEAWSEFRRTGYPKLFPVVKNDSEGEIGDGQFIKRIPYPSYFTSSNPGGVAAAVTNYLHGEDKMSTKLWWSK